jgi:hypothetical protein
MKLFVTYLSLITLCCLSHLALAQDKVFKMTPQDTIVPKVKEEAVPNKIVNQIDRPYILGGFANFQLWGSLLALGISPLAAYKINDRFHFGVGGTLLYSRTTFSNGQEYDATTFGGRVFARYMVFNNLFAHIEYENHYTPTDYILNNRLYATKSWVSGLPIGIDYRTPLGEHTSSTLSFYYNLTHEPNKAPFLYGNLPLIFRLNIEYEF